PSKASRYCPESAWRWPAPSRTTTCSPTAPIDRPDSGMVSGSWRRNSLSERVMRLAGILACASACAVRSTMMSWNENSSARGGGRFRRRGRFGLARRGALALEAGAQRFHQIDNLGAACRFLGHGDLLAFDLLLHRGLDALAYLVLVGAGIEGVGRLLLDQPVG